MFDSALLHFKPQFFGCQGNWLNTCILFERVSVVHWGQQ